MTEADVNTDATLDAPEEVLLLLKEQASLYVKLESLSVRQRLLVTGDDVNPLLTLLADRQRLSERLVRIATRLASVRREWSTYRERLTPPQRAEAERLLSEGGRRLQRVIECDEQDARVLSGRKEAAASDLRTTHSTSRAISAYREPIGYSARLDCVDDAVR